MTLIYGYLGVCPLFLLRTGPRWEFALASPVSQGPRVVGGSASRKAANSANRGVKTK